MGVGRGGGGGVVREGYRDERACGAKSPHQWRVGVFCVERQTCV